MSLLHIGKTWEPTGSLTIVDAWKEMERLLDTGKVKSIGVSNCGIWHLKQLADDPSVKVVPSANLVELHPFLPMQELQEYAKEHNIVLIAYCPFGRFDPHHIYVVNILM
jgi:glycerol 2-dehydrogenase (NADP+)